MEPQAPSINTTCRDCVFATYNGNEQIDCDLDRLDKFEENGAEIIGQDDGSRRYFLVAGRFCNTCRNQDWGAKHASHDWAAIVAKESQVQCCFIIYADHDSSQTEVEETLDSVLDQGPVLPHRIIILLNGHLTEPRTYVRMFRERDVLIPWQVRDVVLDEPGKPITYGEAVDIAVKGITDVTYYCVARAGYRWPANYLVVFNNAINYELIRAVALLPDSSGNGLLMSVALHNQLLNGNKNQPVLEKLLEVASLEETSHMIKEWKNLHVGEANEKT